MEDTKMRKTMMFAVTLLTAACGSISAPKGDDTGAGSDAGSDVGSGSGSDTMPDTGITFDKAGFYDDGTRWWTASDAPTVHGTIDVDPAGQSLDVYAGTTKIGAATITGTTWSIDLPAGTITPAGTTITLKLGTIEQSQTFALDSAAPAITLFGTIKDERGDAIDFSTGEPVHTHAGAAIDLTGTGCPAVYKYAYLMDATKPMYGREVTPNPFAWQIKASDATPLDAMDSAYRVRDDAGRVLYDWTSISPDATGVYNVALYRNVIPELGTYTGKIYMDVRFRDAFGNEATDQTCWDNHPMAAPLEVQALSTGELFGWTLPADSPVSWLLNTMGAAAFSQRFVQHTAEPVTIHVSMAAPAVHYTMTGADYMVPGTTTAVNLSCPDATSGACAPVTDPADKVASGTVGEGWTIRVFDETAGHATSCSAIGSAIACTLPARTANEAPHRYRVDLRLGGVHELWPYEDIATSAGDFAEFQFSGVTYTGLIARSGGTACSHVSSHLVNGQVMSSCTQQTQYTEIRALQKATLSFSQLTETLKTSATASSAGEVPSYATGGLVVNATTWNAGTDVLP